MTRIGIQLRSITRSQGLHERYQSPTTLNSKQDVSKHEDELTCIDDPASRTEIIGVLGGR